MTYSGPPAEAKMKYITIPDAIDIFNIDGVRMNDAHSPEQGATLSFETFVKARLIDARFGADMAAVVAAVEIKKRLKDANGLLVLEEEHWLRLKAATEFPSRESPYHAEVSHNLVPFMRAICNASDTAPSATP